MSSFSTLELQDCQTIAKAFERGANFSVSEASVFAVLTPQLSATQCLTNTISRQMDRYEVASKAPTAGEDEEPVLDIGETAEKIGDNIFPNDDSDLLGGIFNSDCIPCGFRINFKKELNFKTGLEGFGAQFRATLENFLLEKLDQIKQIIGMFKNLDSYVDLCVFLRFLQDFTCIPDLQRILAVLAALLMDLSFELNFVIDLVISLVIPLLLPFLTELIDMLIGFVLLAIRPIECIIDAIQNMLNKLDYNTLFQNLDNIGRISFGPKVGGTIKVGRSVNAPPPINAFTKGVAGVSTTIDASGREFQGDFVPDVFREQKAREQQAVEDAASDLERLNEAVTNLDGTDPAAVERHRQQFDAAKQRYDEAVEERDLSEIGQINKRIEEFQTGMKGSLLQLLTFLREAVIKIDNFVMSVVEEFKKLIGEFVGGNGAFIVSLSKKLAIVQMIGFITAIIRAFKDGINCNEEGKEVETFLGTINRDQDLTIRTDENGEVTIEQSNADIDAALDEVMAAFGLLRPTDPSGNGTPASNNRFDRTGDPFIVSAIPAIPGSSDTSLLPYGTETTSDNQGKRPSDRLKSLIELTGNDTIDLEIAKTVEALTNPARIKFKCPLQTSVSQAEKINRWMKELDEET